MPTNEETQENILEKIKLLKELTDKFEKAERAVYETKREILDKFINIMSYGRGQVDDYPLCLSRLLNKLRCDLAELRGE